VEGRRGGSDVDGGGVMWTMEGIAMWSSGSECGVCREREWIMQNVDDEWRA